MAFGYATPAFAVGGVAGALKEKGGQGDKRRQGDKEQRQTRGKGAKADKGTRSKGRQGDKE